MVKARSIPIKTFIPYSIKAPLFIPALAQSRAEDLRWEWDHGVTFQYSSSPSWTFPSIFQHLWADGESLWGRLTKDLPHFCGPFLSNTGRHPNVWPFMESIRMFIKDFRIQLIAIPPQERTVFQWSFLLSPNFTIHLVLFSRRLQSGYPLAQTFTSHEIAIPTAAMHPMCEVNELHSHAYGTTLGILLEGFRQTVPQITLCSWVRKTAGYPLGSCHSHLICWQNICCPLSSLTKKPISWLRGWQIFKQIPQSPVKP